MGSNHKKPPIFDYMDCSQYLSDIYQWSKLTHPKFSYAIWAQQMGFSNKTIVRFFAQGKRRMAAQSIQKIKEWLSLSAEESQYFDLLVAYSQATGKTQKQSVGSELMKFQRLRYSQTSASLDNFDVYAEIGPVLMTLIGFEDVQLTAKDLAQLFEVPEEAMIEILRQFEKNKLARCQDQIWTGTEKAVKITDHFKSNALRKYYEHWIERSKKAIDLPVEVRRFRSLIFAIDEAEYKKIEEKMNEFAMGLLSQFHSNEIVGKKLYMFNTALFPTMNKKF